ncbi:MAG: L,D-transpeptidase family protein [Zoogloeaceae bacterium]|jgi:murein L,D-transpeptidase YafK|nr:L,D-transpeptidase family protein [Zoogloeaceae bacterium]
MGLFSASSGFTRWCFAFSLLAASLLLGGCLYLLLGNDRQKETPVAPKSAAIADARSDPHASAAPADPESALNDIYADIEAGRLDRAREHVDALIARYPKFRLAYLIQGDLLLARVKPIAALGAAEGVPAEKLEDLRAEALARLSGYRHKPAQDRVPRYLLKMRDDQHYAIVIDTTKSRLYLFRNDAGQARLEKDYYLTQGKLGAEKFAEGDKRTPIGAYYITSWLSPEKLPDLYGNGAFPLNYPNEWDKRRGRGGSGIWLHGTPAATYSRPPKASDGCVVLSNPDFEAVRQKVQVGLTPVIISGNVEWVSPTDLQAERAEILRAIETWRTDWESRDSERYLSHYAASFNSNGQNYATFAAQKRAVNRGKSWIKVQLDHLSVFRAPGPEPLVVVTFAQVYESNNLSNTMTKRQYWQQENGVWKIIYEGSA